MTVDLVIRGGTVLDGTGGDGFRADVAIARGRIDALGALGRVDADELDATGLIVAPGFVDVHSHSDYTLLVDPRAVSAIHQGVTLEVVGNCGHGCFPIRDPRLARSAIYGYSDSVPLTWRTHGEYLDRMEEASPAVNVLSLVPNGQLRLATVGLRDGPAGPAELTAMRGLLERALDEGAWGLSTGLEYAAEAGATAEEVEALCAVVAHRGALYATHTRDRDAGAANAVGEAVLTAERAGVRLQVSHLIPRGGLADGRRCVEVVDAARGRGLDVAFDMHTRLFGFTFLAAALPAEAVEADAYGLAELLRDPSARERLKRHRGILDAGRDWERVVLLDDELWPEYARRDVASIAAERGQEPLDAVYDLLLADTAHPNRLMVLIHCHTEEQQREAFTHPLSMPGSDATTLAPDGPLAASVFHGAYSWAAWYYRYLVRDTGLLSPGEAVSRLTRVPAERLGLRDRGVLRPGAWADVAVFDGDGFGERATTFAPGELAVGMRHVVVNGRVTLRDGALTGTRAGAVLRRGSAGVG
ncbi:MAG: amidohydrolase family protein [Thermoleophilia bacterium]|nr:amidohydrolase family protein [Thermoleophilia bacterium]MDH4346094.1 amidohydrolase family protein [Thermoleophilia bacterium]MDH5332631.1 amidohydrolase family protein [Thermoleophilia bacterium]